ncbi:hypothetical protein C8F01DRAFT_676375 [Mycena amicta]|nr:hypothetical protein C8F01DRAFT_676375 [Mycena amicta]
MISFASASTLLLALPLLGALVHVNAETKVLPQSIILPQCQDPCTKYNDMTTYCTPDGGFLATVQFCECNPTNLTVIETCFNCQSVNATQENEFQQLLDVVVDTCNQQFGSPGNTISLSSLKIQPTAAFPGSTSGKGNGASGTIASVGGLSLTVGLLLGVVGSLFAVF